MTVAAMLLAAAVLLGGETSRARAGLRAPMPARRRAVRDADPLAAASTLEVLAACLRSGMAVSTAAAATALSAPPHLARVLTRAADLLALGADPAMAWSGPRHAGGPARLVTGQTRRRDDHAEALLRLARRSASSGAALALGVAEWPRKRVRRPRMRHVPRGAGVGVDRRAAGAVLSPGVPVPWHRAGYRGVGRRRVAFRSVVTNPKVMGRKSVDEEMVPRTSWGDSCTAGETEPVDGGRKRMSTVEYAIGTIAAAAFGAILYTVVTGDSIVSALTNIINRALNTNV